MKIQNINFKLIEQKPILLYTAALLAVLIWSVAPAVMKLGLSHMDTISLLLCRFMLSSILFIPVVIGVFKKIKTLTVKNWLAFSTIVGVIYFLQMSALKSLPVSWYLVVFSLNPILSLIFMKVSFNKRLLLSLALAIVGTSLFLKFDELSFEISLSSWIYMGGGMLAWVAYSSFLPVMQKSYSDFEITALTSFVGLLSTGVVWVANGSGNLSFDTVGTISSLGLGILFPLAYFLFSFVIRYRPVFGIVSQYLEPVFGIAIAYFFLGESLQWMQILGASLIVSSMGYLAKNLT